MQNTSNGSYTPASGASLPQSSDNAPSLPAGMPPSTLPPDKQADLLNQNQQIAQDVSKQGVLGELNGGGAPSPAGQSSPASLGLLPDYKGQAAQTAPIQQLGDANNVAPYAIGEPQKLQALPNKVDIATLLSDPDIVAGIEANPNLKTAIGMQLQNELKNAQMQNTAAINQYRQEQENQRNDKNIGSREDWHNMLAPILQQKADQQGAAIDQRINKSIAGASASSEKQDFAKTKWLADQWQKFNKAVDPLTSSSRQAIGQSGINNIRAERVIETMQNPNIVKDPVVYKQAMLDLAGIFKGGVPDVGQEKQQSYDNIKTGLGSLIQKITANPQEIDQPEVKTQILNMVSSLKDVDNEVINKNLGVNKVVFDYLQKYEPQKFEQYLSAFSNIAPTTKTPEINIGGTTPIKISSDAEYDKLPSGAQFIGPDGKPRRKP
jgi:hypothetical protein